MDDYSGDTHASLGRIIAFYDWDWGAAELEFKRALELNPNSSIVHLDYSHFLELIPARQEEAIIEARKAKELDPLSVGIAMGTGEQLFFAGRLDDAIENSKNTIMMDPNQFYSHFLLGLAYAGKSMMKEAIAELKKTYELSDGASMAAWVLANTHYRTGANAEADKLFDDLKEKAKREYVPSYYFFTLYRVRGEFEQTFKWLEKACEEHDLWLPLALVWPDDAYRIPYDQKSTELLKKVGLIK
jgi:tetratricopeptide (TPR) repeat protein